MKRFGGPSSVEINDGNQHFFLPGTAYSRVVEGREGREGERRITIACVYVWSIEGS